MALGLKYALTVLGPFGISSTLRVGQFMPLLGRADLLSGLHPLALLLGWEVHYTMLNN